MRAPMRTIGLVLAGIYMAAARTSAEERFADEASPELTAAFIFNFARYTAWPDSSLGDPSRPLVFLILGDERIVDALKQLTPEPMHGRGVLARRIAPTSRDLPRSHVVFVGSDYRAKASAILEQLGSADVLTIGCFPGFARDGGMLNLEVRDNHMRFEANPDSIKRSALHISSEVLELATIVHEDGDSR